MIFTERLNKAIIAELLRQLVPQAEQDIAQLDYNTDPMGTVLGLEVVAVDGDKVKERFEMDFVEGGNDQRYGFIPPKTVWVDNRLDKEDWRYIILHETVERTLMKYLGLTYDQAHEIANWEERKDRRQATAE